MDKAHLVSHADKGARSELLPSRHALNQLTGDPSKRVLGNYSKSTPSIDNGTGPDIFGKDLVK